jgi:hypothetical protein
MFLLEGREEVEDDNGSGCPVTMQIDENMKEVRPLY